MGEGDELRCAGLTFSGPGSGPSKFLFLVTIRVLSKLL
jgi:hypothetical protein